jgi:hypothetical protein
VTKIAVTAIRFFLNEDGSKDAESDSEEDADNVPRGKEAAAALHRFSKKTKKRQRQASRVALRTSKMKSRVPNAPLFPAIQVRGAR